jgi:hypothetical protein
MNNRKFTAVVVMLLIATTLACTIPVNFAPVPEVEEKIVYVEITSTPAEEAAVEDEDEEEEQDTADVVEINIDGPWTIWQGSAEQKLSIDFLQKGSEVVGNTATGNGHSLLFNGTISTNGKSVSGTWESTSGTSGNFMMEFNDALNSFSGNLGGGVPFCGTRMGSSKPYPCLN